MCVKLSRHFALGTVSHTLCSDLKSRVGDLTPNGGATVHVLGGVLQQPMAAIVVLDVVEGHGLEAPPAQREDDGVPRLQDATVPAVLLQPHLWSITHTRLDLA